ncbi:uncharacterized protein [Dermacentor andersoni]|uniref:uncharacterized protein n=1 Tax=Dermacentor andersoni TaxID=34620 RepID=UPI0024168501|nr:uncharacterized protein LOC126539092 [Dermacentor andersoni]
MEKLGPQNFINEDDRCGPAPLEATNTSLEREEAAKKQKKLEARSSAWARTSFQELDPPAVQISPRRHLRNIAKMGDKSEMSMSVQSAWEDLVVENPNRRKLEACLVTTIMIVVVCIMGLLLFVVIELQPADNLKRVKRRPNVVDCNNGTCPEFAHRVLGWINFQVKPCEDFHTWVCHGRLKDSPEDTFQQDSQRAGTYAANAYFYNLLMRNYHHEESTGNKVEKPAFTYMVKLFDICLRGLEKHNGTHPLKDLLDQTLWSGTLKGFAGASQVSVFEDIHVDLIQKFNFHPFGRIMRRDDEWFVMPMSLLGTLEQVNLGGFQKEFTAAYGAFAVKYKKGSADDAPASIKVEVSIVKEMDISALEGDYPGNHVIGVKTQHLKIPEIIEKVYGVTVTGKIFGRHPSQAKAIIAYDAGGHGSMNLAMFKFLLKLSLFMDEDDPDLAPFFAFANKYEWGSKVLPVKVYRCGTFLEDYLKPAMMQFIFHYDKERLDAISSEIQTRMTEFTAPGPDKKTPSFSLRNLQLAKGKLADWAGNLTALEFFFTNKTDEDVKAYFSCGGNALEDWDDGMHGGFLAHLSKLGELYACNLREHKKKEIFSFPVLGSEPYYDFISDKTYVPFGFTMPPNFHPYVPGIFHHNAPALYFKLIGEVFRMTLARAFSATKKDPEGKVVFDTINCYRKLVNPKSKNKTGATQIFIDTVAVPMAYTMYRNVLNHAKWDVGKQARVSLIPFFTEGQYFFIQAAQSRCEHMDTDPKIAYLRARGGATAADKVNLPFAKNNPLFSDRFGCAKQRPMYAKENLCKGPMKPLKRETEKEYPGVYV